MFWRRLLSVMCAAAIAASVRADITVYLDDGQPADDDDLLLWQASDTGNWHIILQKLYNPGGVTVYEIRGNGGETIERIIIHVPCWEAPNGNCVPAGSPVFVRVLSDPPLGIKTVESIEQSGTAETLLTHVVVTEDIGQIDAQAIGILDAGRDIVGPITSFTPDNPMRGISEVYAGRHILGDLTALNGKIGVVHAAENIGTPDRPVNIQFKYNPLDIKGLDIYANIDTRIGAASGGNGSLWRMEAWRFFGTLDTPHISHHHITGEPGLVRIHEKLLGSIRIGHSFDDPDHLVELPIAGVEGQIVVNADNEGGVWTAPMHLGALNDPDHSLIVGPDYTQTSAELGGGAIGAVPFRLHHASSNPASGSLVLLEPENEPVTVELEHYGPLHLTGDPPVTILRRPIDGGIYVSVPLENFDVSILNDDAKTLTIGPAEDGPGFEPGYLYRISATSALRSDAAGFPPVSWTLPYFVSVDMSEQDPRPRCEGDLTGDFAVGVPDLLSLLAAWGPCLERDCAADLSGDAQVGVPDLLILLSNWGACE